MSYFSMDDFETFRPDVQSLNTKEIRDRRKMVQEKLLILNDDIKEYIEQEGLEIYTHPKKNHITSLIYPCTYNHNCVDWLGVRYGKAERDILELNKTFDMARGFNPGKSSKNCADTNQNTEMQFQKHACIQVDISYDGVDVGIFHAVPWGAVDRMYLRDIIYKEDIDKMSKIQDELNNIKFYGYQWRTYNTMTSDESNKHSIFDFDSDNIADFFKWYQNNDIEGCYSSMMQHFPRYDERISSNNIVDTCKKVIKQVYPLYKAISWDISYKGDIEI